MKKEIKKPVKKETKEIKKKAAAPVKKAAIKPKKETKPQKAAKPHVAAKVEAPRIEHKIEHKVEHIEKPKQIEEIRPKLEKKKPAKIVGYNGTGGRKTASARVWLYPGSGKYMINGRPMESWTYGRKLLQNMAIEPFVLTETMGKYDVFANVIGGGSTSQVGAVRHALADAMQTMNPEFRPVLKKSGLLTRDPREKERKKYGQKKARKRFQYSKR